MVFDAVYCVAFGAGTKVLIYVLFERYEVVSPLGRYSNPSASVVLERFVLGVEASLFDLNPAIVEQRLAISMSVLAFSSGFLLIATAAFCISTQKFSAACLYNFSTVTPALESRFAKSVRSNSTDHG
jgi:hypothetical protein